MKQTYFSSVKTRKQVDSDVVRLSSAKAFGSVVLAANKRLSHAPGKYVNTFCVVNNDQLPLPILSFIVASLYPVTLNTQNPS